MDRDTVLFAALGAAPYASLGAFALAQYLPGPYPIFVAIPSLMIGGASMFLTFGLAPLILPGLLAELISNRVKPSVVLYAAIAAFVVFCIAAVAHWLGGASIAQDIMAWSFCGAVAAFFGLGLDWLMEERPPE